jgi:RNA polymerase sigma factor (sigma-70 family)
MDDTELAARLATDLDGAFEALVRAHADRCHSIALRVLADPSDAEEVAQDALVRAYRALAGYERERIRALRLRPWLAAIVVNLARNRRRRVSDRRPAVGLGSLADPEGAMPPGRRLAAGHDELRDGASAEQLVSTRADRERWAVCLAGLPDRYRVPLVLRHVDDLSYAEMSEALGRSEGTLKSQVHRGLALLRAAWESAEREEAIA